MPDIGAFELDFVCDRLRRFAAEYGAAGAPARYVLAGGALLNERRVHAEAGLMMRIMNRYRRLVTVELPFSADTVLVKSNIRIVGFGRKSALSAKVQVRRRPGASLRREIRTRKILAAAFDRSPELGRRRGFAIPKVLAAGAMWLVEENIAGRHAGTIDIARFLSTYAPAFYESTARMRALRPLDAVDVLLNEASKFVPGLNVEAFDRPWPFALCHADLLDTNMLRAPDGGLWLLDWEQASVMPVAFDLGKLCASYPEVTGRALDVLRRLSRASDPVAPELQLVLSLARESKMHAAQLATHVADQMQYFGKSRREAEEMHRWKSTEIAALMRSVGVGR